MVTPAISISTNIKFPTNITATSSSSGPVTHKPKSLNSTVKSLSKSGKLDEALHLIESQPTKPSPTQPDLDTCSSILHACISTKSLHQGQRLYLQLLLSRTRSRQDEDLLTHPTLISKLITLYSVCGQIHEARRIFDDARTKSVPEPVWVAMAIAYLKNGYAKETLMTYHDMLCDSVQPGNFVFSTALKACSILLYLWVGKAIHAQIMKCHENPDQVVYNALLKLYSECGCFDEVLQMFDEMPKRNVVSWNSLVAGFVARGQPFEGVKVFRKMQREGMGFTWVSLTTVLSACAKLTALYGGKEIHAQILKSVGTPDVLVMNSLLDMYAKCGAVGSCEVVFSGMIIRDLTTWNTMLRCYATNGRMKEAMYLFDEMVGSGFCPDGVSFIALLSGCSHAGLTHEGRKFFDRMSVDFRISPNLEHYACLVDILGRAGEIKEALEVVRNMPMKPTGSIWGSLLNSCRIHHNVPLAEGIAKRLFMIEPNNLGNYVMLSNIYANAGMWTGVKMVREMMERRGIKKEPGCSWLLMKNRIHTFIASGSFEFRNTPEYKKVWTELMDAMEEVGYVLDTKGVLHDVNEELKKEWVCGHSERLATMFGLIHTGFGMPIRITKNLRVCVDCHSWMKIVSKVTRRVIILRDTNHFHHFEQGTCSCKDYW